MRISTAPLARLGGSPKARQPSRAGPKAVARATASRPGWLDRLAAWADRQPPHHRLGHWTLG